MSAPQALLLLLRLPGLQSRWPPFYPDLAVCRSAIDAARLKALHPDTKSSLERGASIPRNSPSQSYGHRRAILLGRSRRHTSLTIPFSAPSIGTLATRSLFRPAMYAPNATPVRAHRPTLSFEILAGTRTLPVTPSPIAHASPIRAVLMQCARGSSGCPGCHASYRDFPQKQVIRKCASSLAPPWIRKGPARL